MLLTDFPVALLQPLFRAMPALAHAAPAASAAGARPCAQTPLLGSAQRRCSGPGGGGVTPRDPQRGHSISARQATGQGVTRTALSSVHGSRQARAAAATTARWAAWCPPSCAAAACAPTPAHTPTPPSTACCMCAGLWVRGRLLARRARACLLLAHRPNMRGRWLVASALCVSHRQPSQITPSYSDSTTRDRTEAWMVACAALPCRHRCVDAGGTVSALQSRLSVCLRLVAVSAPHVDCSYVGSQRSKHS